jgi:hypothetical protein
MSEHNAGSSNHAAQVRGELKTSKPRLRTEAACATLFPLHQGIEASSELPIMAPALPSFYTNFSQNKY